jgi:hypothetical protein
MVDVDCGEPRTHDGFDHSETHSGAVFCPTLAIPYADLV